MATTVRSKLARKDSKDKASTRCTSTYTVKKTFGPWKKGEVIHCTRPASRHRVHEGRSVQW